MLTFQYTFESSFFKGFFLEGIWNIPCTPINTERQIGIGKYEETFQSNLQILLIPRHVHHIQWNSINETQKHFSMRKLEIHHSPYIHEMNENKFGFQMKNHQMGLLLISYWWEKQNPNTVLKETIWNIP